VRYFCLALNEQIFSYIMARTSYISMRWCWWNLLWTKPQITVVHL